MRPLRPFRSFRLRLALFSMTCTAVILLLSGGAVYYLLLRGGAEEVERRLERQARVLYESPVWPPPWKRLESGLRAEWPEAASSPLLLFVVRNSDGRTVHLSEDWPAALNPKLWLRALSPGNDRREPAEPEAPRHAGPPDDLLSHPDRPGPPEEPGRSMLQVRPRLRTRAEADGRQWLVTAFSDRGYTAVFCVARDSAFAQLRRLGNAFAVAFPGALLLSFVAALLVVQRALQPVRSLTETVARIRAEGLDERVDTRSADREFARLLEVFNGMLDRLQRSFENAHRFTGNAAHELKTPLAILQGNLEAAIRLEEAGSERQRFLSDRLDEVARLKSIIERLLLLSRADAGRLDLHIDTVDMTELINGIAEDAALLAPHLRIRTCIPRNITARCDRALIAQVVHNMVSNAIKYNLPEGGELHLELGRMKGHVIVRVTNSGRHVPPEMHERIFDRFHRGDRSRSEGIDGAGLGLSLAREIARAHSGDLILSESTSRRTRFVLQLPGGSHSPVEGRPGASSAFASAAV